MKTKLRFVATAVIALLAMSACNNEMDEQNPANGKLQPVQFQMEMANTRTTTGDETTNRETNWTVGDAIGVFAYPAGSTTNATAVNAKYILGSNNSWTAEAGNEIYPDQKLDYYAYYPYQEGVTDPKLISISALADQSKIDGSDYGMSDILASQSKNVEAGQGKVTLLFKHMFAMVEVKVQGDLVTQKPTKVELKGVKLGATLDLIAGTPATIDEASATKDVTMYCLENPDAQSTAKVYSFRAAVPDQTIAASTPLVAIYAPDADSKTYTMQHPAEVRYAAGSFRQLVVNIGSKRVVLIIPNGNLSISPWTPSDAIAEDGGEVVPNLVSIAISSLTENITNFTADSEWITAMRDPAKPTSSQWYTIDDGATLSATVANGTITIKKTTQGAWNKGVVGFHYAPQAEETQITSGYYKLSIKATAAGGGQLRVIVRDSYMGDPDGAEEQYSSSYNWFYPEANKIAANMAINATEDPEATYSRILDFTKITSNSGGSGSAATIVSTNDLANTYKFFDIRLFPNAANKEYTIYDVKLEPCEAPVVTE